MKALLSAHRTRIMGLAALMVIVYHCYIPASTAVGSFFPGSNGKAGVDIFVFLSGYGLSFSLRRDPDFYFTHIRRNLRPAPAAGGLSFGPLDKPRPVGLS